MSDIRGYVKLSVVGPSRVGKTSLTTAILDNAQELLRGMPVSIKPAGRQTEKKIHQHRNDMRGSIAAGEFNPGGLGGTQEPFTFEFQMCVGDHSIRFGYLDFPGGWLTEGMADSYDKGQAAWHECETWIRESQALLVPIDAAVLMETTRPKHTRAVPSILAVSEVEQVAVEWAKHCNNASTKPALFVLAPVKCEAYFDDNGGRFNKSEELFVEVQRTYRPVLEAVRGEFDRGSTRLQILYSPVDTYGCVEFTKPYWRETEGPEGFEFSADYRIREPGRVQPLGAADIMSAICRNVLSEGAQLAEAYRTMLEADHEALTALQRDRKWWQRFVEFLSGAARDRARILDELVAEGGQAGEALKQIQEAIEFMSARPLGSRAKIL
jgi:hypothetical protein